MGSMIDDLMGHLKGTGGVGEIAENLGVGSDKVTSMLGSVLPAVLGGLAGNAATHKGAESLREAVISKHDGSILDSVGGLLGNIDLDDGGKILGHVFGGKQDAVSETLAVKSDAQPGVVQKLMAMVAPMVMGWLGKQVLSGKLNADDLGSLLGKEKKKAVKKDSDLGDLLGSGGGLGGLLGSVLGGATDGEDDGFGLDDVVDMASGNKGGLLGTLGKLFGRK